MVYFKKLALLCALLSPSLAFAQSWNSYAASPTNQYGLTGISTMPGCFQCGVPFIIEVPDADTAGFWKFSAPFLSVAGENSPAGYGNGGVWVTKATLQSPEFPLGAGPALYGATPVNTVISIPFSPNNAGHITSLAVSNLSAASCTTAPSFNVIDYVGGSATNAGNLAGTQLAGPAVGAINGSSFTKNAQTLAFNPGDLVSIFVNSVGSGCTGSTFAVSAEVSIP
jgi:hypothetical protein